MRVLGIDTASRTVGAAVLQDENVLAETSLRTPRGASSLLPGVARDLMDHLGMSLSDLDGLAVTIGPGSFTGLRIACSLVAGLSYSRGLAAVGITSTRALAASLPGVPRGGTVLAALRAGRGAVFAALYRCQETDGHLRWLPMEVTEPCRLSGDGVQTLVDTQVQNMESLVCVVDSDDIPRELGALRPVVVDIRPGAVALLGHHHLLQGEVHSPEVLHPRYFRLSAAERQAGEEGRP